MSTVKFAATKLNGTGKRGILKPDDDGYYTMPIGGLNVFNSVNEYYTLEGAKELFESSSMFMKRVQNGALKGEVGHPKMTPGMSEGDYLNRILSIEETNVCAHFKEIWLDEGYGKAHPEYKNSALVAIMGKVKPSGPKGSFLKEMFDDPDQNVCFSIRALSKDYYERGQKYKILATVIAFDAVNMPGISHATKWASPSLETLDQSTVQKNDLENLLKRFSPVATEDSKQMAIEALQCLNKPSVIRNPPLYKQW